MGMTRQDIIDQDINAIKFMIQHYTDQGDKEQADYYRSLLEES